MARPTGIELLLSDINAIQRGKWLPGDDAEKLVSGAVRLPMSTYAPNIMGQEVEATGLGIIQGDPDGRIVPILGTLRPVPWAEGHVAQVQVEMRMTTAQISFLSARQQLAKVLDRFADTRPAPGAGDRAGILPAANAQDQLDPAAPALPPAQGAEL